MSVFAKYVQQAWPYEFAGHLTVHNLVGGVPSDPNIAEGWIRSKGALGPNAKDDLVRQAVAEVMAERKVGTDEAVAIVTETKTLNGFKRDPDTGELYIEGRQLKAAIKEAASVAYSTGRLLNNGKNSWGRTSKGLSGFVAEHIIVVEDRLMLGVKEPSQVLQQFVHTFRGSSVQYSEVIEIAEIDFTVQTDYGFTERQWAMLWLTGEVQGLGASRSQSFGRYEVTRWEQVRGPVAADGEE